MSYCVDTSNFRWIQRVVCAVLVASVAACCITATSAHADPYLPLYSNADSEDILSLQNDVPFRFLPDIDGDGRPETLTVENGSTCRTSVIHRSSFLSNGALTTADSAGQWKLFDSGRRMHRLCPYRGNRRREWRR